MQCDSCSNEAVISQKYSGRHLCYRHLAADLEAKAKRSIRAHHWLKSGDRIGVVVSGDKRSGALLHFMKKLTMNRRDVCLRVIPVDRILESERIGLSAEQVAAFFDVPCIRSVTRATRGGLNEDERIGNGADMLPGNLSCAGIRELAGITKIAVAVSLEDVAREVLIRFLRGRVDTLLHLQTQGLGTIPVICPFSPVPATELELYWDSLGYGIVLSPSPHVQEGFTDRTDTLLGEYNTRHPATLHALLHLGEQLTGETEMSAGTMTIPPIPAGVCGMVRNTWEEQRNGT